MCVFLGLGLRDPANFILPLARKKCKEKNRFSDKCILGTTSFWAIKSLTDGKKLDPLILAQVKTGVDNVIFFLFYLRMHFSLVVN